jgi:hypothetical protein
MWQMCKYAVFAFAFGIAFSASTQAPLATFLLFVNRAPKPLSRYESSNCRNGNTPGNFRRHAEKIALNFLFTAANKLSFAQCRREIGRILFGNIVPVTFIKNFLATTIGSAYPQFVAH